MSRLALAKGKAGDSAAMAPPPDKRRRTEAPTAPSTSAAPAAADPWDDDEFDDILTQDNLNRIDDLISATQAASKLPQRGGLGDLNGVPPVPQNGTSKIVCDDDPFFGMFPEPEAAYTGQNFIVKQGDVNGWEGGGEEGRFFPPPPILPRNFGGLIAGGAGDGGIAQEGVNVDRITSELQSAQDEV